MLPMPLGWFDRAEIEPFYRSFGFKFLPAAVIVIGLIYLYGAVRNAQFIYRSGSSLGRLETLGFANPWRIWTGFASTLFIVGGVAVLALFWNA
ncbi:MAG: hypothetical protein IT461_08095 [Planctomycetes bacterium]|jgi:hypothetical protein|nr:hypothetical protein [Planctomycetota bacterium]